MSFMEKLIKILHEGKYSCVVESQGEIHTFSKRGVADLYDMVKNRPNFLKDARIADKVIGKGAAALIVLGGVNKVYADIISLSALTLLREANIDTSFGQSVPYILNRSQTDGCPLEKRCQHESSAEAILPLIEDFIAEMRSKQ